MMLSLKSFNLIPAEIRQENQSIKIRKMLKKYIRLSVMLLGMVLLVEGLGIWWFSGVVVPASLESEYQKAKVEIEVIKKELAIIERSKGEEQWPLVAFSGVLRDKPIDIGFTKVEIGQMDVKNDAWVSFEGVAANPVVFREYAIKLNQNPIFSGAVIHKIDTNSVDNSKTAVVKISKK